MYRQNRPLVAIVAIAGLFFLLMCLLASSNSGFFDSMARVVAEPWGFATLLDVWLGGICMGIVIYMREANLVRALIWTFFILLGGHIVSVIWLLTRGLRGAL